MKLNSRALKKRIAQRYSPVLVGWTIIYILVTFGLHQTLVNPQYTGRTVFGFPILAFVLYVFLWLVGFWGMSFSAYQVYKFVAIQKKIQNELRQSEYRFRQLVELSPNTIAVHQDGVIVFINRTGLTLLKARSESEIIGKPMIDFVHPESRSLVLKRVAEMTRTGQPVGWVEEKFVALDGSAIEVGVTSTPLEFRGKLAFQVIIEDLTVRKRLERAIKSIELGISSAIGQEFFESAACQLANVLDSHIVFIGEYLAEAERVRTISVCEDGKKSENFEYPLKGAPCENVINQQLCCYASGVATLFPDDKALLKNGVEGYLGMPLWDSQHHPIGIIVALYCSPISSPDFAKELVQIFASRVEAEMERSRALNELVESKAQLEAAFNNFSFR